MTSEDIYAQLMDKLQHPRSERLLRIFQKFMTPAEAKMKLRVKPYLEDKIHGVFATRAPVRPNPVGMSIVELLDIDTSKCFMKIRGVDMIDNTPLLDIKPFIPYFDNRKATVGWLKSTNYRSTSLEISDDRF